MWKYFILYILLLFFKITSQKLNQDLSNDIHQKARWCTKNDKEEQKCLRMQKAFIDINAGMEFSCVHGGNKSDCMIMLEKHKADLMAIDAGDVYVAGRFHSLIPIMMESSELDVNIKPFYYSMGVIKKNLPLRSLWDLRGKRLCSPGVMQMAGWMAPISLLLKKQIMPIVDCNNHVKSVADFFGPSCIPNVLDRKHNPIGDNPSKLCEMCRGNPSTVNWCTDNDPYAGYSGALQCLLDNRGDIAFVKHNSIRNKVINNPFFEQNYELLCSDGSRRPLKVSAEAPQTCHWGKVPMPAIVTVSSKSYQERKEYQNLLFLASDAFGAKNPNAIFHLFDSTMYGDSNIIYLDSSKSFIPIEEKLQTFENYIGNEYLDYIHTLHRCSIDFVRLCVVSEPELKKCNNMHIAFSSQGLQPKVMCIMTRSHQECMTLIRNDEADIVVVDSGDVFRGGKYYNLVPIMTEIYDKEEPIYYAVAVVKKLDKDTSLLELKGKRSCHGGVAFSAGWNIPITFMFNHGRMRSSGCINVAKSVSEYFQKSCAPGLLSGEYNHRGFSMSNMCDLCIGTGENYCSRDHSEPYFGYTGAFRCMAEGGGDVAFVKHTTPFENTNGRRPDIWSRGLISDDYELLCRDGTRKNINHFEECNLGLVPSNALMTSSYKNYTSISAITNLFFYGQRFFGSKNGEDFKLFGSAMGFSDLIFQDSTTQLRIINSDHQNYADYLGHDYLKIIEKIDCFGGCSHSVFSIYLLLISFLFNYLT